MPLSISDTDSRSAPSRSATCHSADDARAGSSASDAIARILHAAPPPTAQLDMCPGAMLLCPHCNQILHVQLSACRLDVSIIAPEPAPPDSPVAAE